MGDRKSARRLLLVVSLAALSFAQETPQHAVEAAREKISLGEVSSVDVASLPGEYCFDSRRPRPT
jgi:hypothetical protein